MPDYIDDTHDVLLKRQLLALDVLLRRKQNFWETPRNIAILVGVVAAVAGALGFHFGSQPQQLNVHLDQPIILKQSTPDTLK